MHHGASIAANANQRIYSPVLGFGVVVGVAVVVVGGAVVVGLALVVLTVHTLAPDVKTEPVSAAISHWCSSRSAHSAQIKPSTKPDPLQYPAGQGLHEVAPAGQRWHQPHARTGPYSTSMWNAGLLCTRDIT